MKVTAVLTWAWASPPDTERRVKAMSHWQFSWDAGSELQKTQRGRRGPGEGRSDVFSLSF